MIKLIHRIYRFFTSRANLRQAGALSVIAIVGFVLFGSPLLIVLLSQDYHWLWLYPFTITAMVVIILWMQNT